MLKISTKNKIAIIELDKGTTNAISPALVSDLRKKLREMSFENEIRAIILTSSNTKFFSIGLNIPELYELSKEDFTQFYSSFNELCIELYSYPKPVLAMINGHAIAAGCILALCCDYRFISQGKKLMGLNEIKLGVPIPYPALQMLENMIGSEQTKEFVYTGEFLSPESLLELGIVDKIYPLDELLECSLNKCLSLIENPSVAFTKIKLDLKMPIVNHIKTRLESHIESFVDSWYSEETRVLLKDAIKKF
ncbi:MAG: enoyl-CoA hydratase/isomerase family protein [Candidatus Hodarchaeales archaeon]|jgi:enoyl-CoA hydratase/carnithine racemase